MRRPLLIGLVGGSAGIALASSQRGRRALQHSARWAGQHAQYQLGRAKGAVYRLSGRHPNADVDLRTLADRVRSTLGPLEKRLDLPHIHVMAEDHVILLHGEVATESEADRIEQTVRQMPGVDGVESYLHVGLIQGDTRPSQGRSVTQPSQALERLLGAARAAGADEHTDKALVRAVLASLAERLPADEREQLFTHLPSDVRALAQPPRRHGRAPARVRHVGEFVAATGADSIDPSRATEIVESVLAVVRDLVPEEAPDVTAVLPAELKPLWQHSAPQ